MVFPKGVTVIAVTLFFVQAFSNSLDMGGIKLVIFLFCVIEDG